MSSLFEKFANNYKTFGLVLFMIMSSSVYTQESVIYGRDGRKGIGEIKSKKLKNILSSTALVVDRQNMISVENKNAYNVLGLTLSQRGWCEDEKFVHELGIGHCSSFLVAPNKILTAGHCIRNQYECDQSVFVFDYKGKKTVDEYDVLISKNKVYNCKKVLSSKFNTDYDYALIELDRSVLDRSPMKLDLNGNLSKFEPLFTVGNPMGIGQKIALGGNLKFDEGIKFYANLDTFSGNSGSAVLNRITKKVEGILIEGIDDVVLDEERNCLKVNRCKNNLKKNEELKKSCIEDNTKRSGEIVLKISAIKDELKRFGVE